MGIGFAVDYALKLRSVSCSFITAGGFYDWSFLMSKSPIFSMPMSIGR